MTSMSTLGSVTRLANIGSAPRSNAPNTSSNAAEIAAARARGSSRPPVRLASPSASASRNARGRTPKNTPLMALIPAISVSRRRRANRAAPAVLDAMAAIPSAPSVTRKSSGRSVLEFRHAQAKANSTAAASHAAVSRDTDRSARHSRDTAARASMPIQTPSASQRADRAARRRRRYPAEGPWSKLSGPSIDRAERGGPRRRRVAGRRRLGGKESCPWRVLYKTKRFGATVATPRVSAAVHRNPYRY
jgi:hypothetical protein